MDTARSAIYYLPEGGHLVDAGAVRPCPRLKSVFSINCARLLKFFFVVLVLCAVRAFVDVGTRFTVLEGSYLFTGFALRILRLTDRSPAFTFIGATFILRCFLEV